MNNKQVTNGATVSFPFFQILTLIFIVLKLTGYIDWSWWWVTCPLWGGFALILSIYLFLAFIAAFVIAIMFVAWLCTGRK